MSVELRDPSEFEWSQLDHPGAAADRIGCALDHRPPENRNRVRVGLVANYGSGWQAWDHYEHRWLGEARPGPGGREEAKAELLEHNRQRESFFPRWK